MSVVAELILTENDGSLSFGNHELTAKAKLDNYEVGGDLYKVKTYCDITKLEKNGMFVYESVPGTSVHGFAASEDGVSFAVEAAKDCQITVGLVESEEYTIYVDGEAIGQMKTNMSGKLSVSLEMDPGVAKRVAVQK